MCKDNRWAITSPSQELTGGSILDRARGFGLPTREVDGLDAEATWRAAAEEIQRIRDGGGPGFIWARCSRLDGHFLGDPAPSLLRTPGELAKRTGPLMRAVLTVRGAGIRERLNSLGGLTILLQQLASRQEDPLTLLRSRILSSWNISCCPKTGWSSWVEEAEQRLASMYRQRELKRRCPDAGKRSPSEQRPCCEREMISPW